MLPPIFFRSNAIPSNLNGTVILREKLQTQGRNNFLKIIARIARIKNLAIIIASTIAIHVYAECVACDVPISYASPNIIDDYKELRAIRPVICKLRNEYDRLLDSVLGVNS